MSKLTITYTLLDLDFNDNQNFFLLSFIQTDYQRDEREQFSSAFRLGDEILKLLLKNLRQIQKVYKTFMENFVFLKNDVKT